MGQVIDVPGAGRVEFPDGMSDDDIVAAIKKNRMSWAPVKQDPSNAAVAVNAGYKGLAGIPDQVLNTPNKLLNLGRAAVGTAATAFGRPDMAPDLTPDREYAGALMRKLGLIKDSAEPTTGGQRLLDAVIQGGVGGAVNPASGLRQVAGLAGMGATMGASGELTHQATGNDALAITAGLLTPSAAANSARLAQRLRPQDVGGRIMNNAIGDPVRAQEVRQRMIDAQELVPGSAPMAHQVADSPGLSQMARTVKNIIPGGGQMTQRERQQNTARMGLLDVLAPGALGMTSIEAKTNAGAVLMDRATPLRDASNKDVGTKYGDIDPFNQGLVGLPIKYVDEVVGKYFGKGSGGAPAELTSLVDDIRALGTVQEVPEVSARLRELAQGKPRPSAGTPSVVDLQTLSNLRSRASEMAYKAGQAGDKRAASAAVQIKEHLDATLEEVAGRAAMRNVLETGADAPAAMFRKGLGEIDFPFGNVGVWSDTKGKFVKGSGASHIVGNRDLDGVDGVVAALSLPEVLARGQVLRTSGDQPGNRRINIGLGDAQAVLSEGKNGHWLLNGWNNELPVGVAPEVRPASDYAPGQSFIRDRVGATGSGASVGQPGEYFSNDMAQAARAARQAKIEHEARFGTGPSELLWKDGTTGAPRLQGGQVFDAFFNPGAAQAAHMGQFNRMMAGDAPTLGAFQKAAISDLAGRAVAPNSGTLNSHPFQQWVKARAEALPRLLDNEQQGLLGNLGADLKRAARADGLGLAIGSNTAQNLEGGLMFGRPVGLLANIVPKLGPSGLEWLRQHQKLSDAKKIEGLLLDPKAAARAMGPRELESFSLTDANLGGLLGLLNALQPTAHDRTH